MLITPIFTGSSDSSAGPVSSVIDEVSSSVLAPSSSAAASTVVVVASSAVSSALLLSSSLPQAARTSATSTAMPVRRMDECVKDPPEMGSWDGRRGRSEEHTSELQSLMRTSYAVFCLKKKTIKYKTKE